MQSILPRESGISLIGAVPWGTHFCQLYQTKSDLIDILVPFFKAGLENNEFCVWVIADPVTPEDAARAMATAVPNFESYLTTGQIEITMEPVLKDWVEKYPSAAQERYEGLRFAGNPASLEKDLKNPAGYEAVINKLISDYPVLALCTCSIDKCNVNDLIDLVLNHEFALIKRGGQWEVIRSSMNEKVRADTARVNNDLRAQNKDLRESEERIQSKLDSILSPDADILEQQLGSIIDNVAVQSLMYHLYEVTGIGFAIIDLKGKVLVGTGWQDVCTRFHRTNPQTLRNCIESDIQLTRGVKKGEFREYKCKNNMYDIVTPLFIGDKQVANIFTRQFFFEDEEPDYACFNAQAEQYGFDKEAYLAAVKRAPRLNRDKVKNIMNFYTGLSEMISRLSYANVKIARSMSELKNAQESVQASEEKYRGIVETSYEGVWLSDGTGITTFVNQRMADMLGYAPEDMIGKPVQNFLLPEDKELLNRRLKQSPSGYTAQYERLLPHKNGKTRWFSISVSTIARKPGDVLIVSMLTDITERKLAEISLANREAELSAILDSVPMMVMLFDSDRHIIESNRAASAFALRTHEEMPTLRLGEALRCVNCNTDPRGCGFSEKCQSCVARLTIEDTINLGTSHYNVEAEFEFKRGEKLSRMSSLLSALPLNLPEKRALVCIQDITDLKKSERQIQQMNQILTRRAMELETANKEMESFSYSVSHDLRAPLRSMDGFSQALAEDYSDKLDDTARNYLKRIQDSSKLMSDLIDDMLRLSRITRSGMQPEIVDLSAMAESVIKELEKANPARKVAVAVNSGMKACGDAKLLQVVLENLIQNAWKFTGKTTYPRIEIGQTEVNREIAFYVRDNGAGFDMRYVEKLFAPFQRLHKVTDFPGTGIGLATVQRVVHRHGGRVWAEGAINKGATFFFTIPEER